MACAHWVGYKDVRRVLVKTRTGEGNASCRACQRQVRIRLGAGALLLNSTLAILPVFPCLSALIFALRAIGGLFARNTGVYILLALSIALAPVFGLLCLSHSLAALLISRFGLYRAGAGKAAPSTTSFAKNEP